MAAYSAVVFFRQTLKERLDSYQLPLDFTKPQIVSLYEKVCSMQSALERISIVPEKWRGSMNELQTRIREGIYAAQDKIDYWISKDLSLERYDEISLKEIADDIDLLVEEAMDMAEAIPRDPGAQKLFSDISQTPKSSLSGKTKRTVGQEEDFRIISDWLELDDKQLLIIPIVGLPGLGKTALARSIYDDKRVRSQFNFRAWVTVSQDFTYHETFSKMLSSMESKNYHAGHYATQGDEQALRNRLHQELYNQRYLIVIDDMWEASVWDRIKLALPDKENGSRVLVTTRISAVARTMSKINGLHLIHEMKPLDVEDSWELLCSDVFGDDPCPPRLREIGRRIAKKCKGLPLSITVIGGLLSQSRNEIEYWKKIEEEIGNTAASGDSSYQEILSLSYNHLPPELKGCFLYMGAFPEDSEILVSKLIKLWVAEGFLPAPKPDRDMEAVARDSLTELIDRNLISVRKKSSNGEIKVCSVHDSLLEVAVRESRREKFFYSVKKYGRKQEEDVQMQRRVSVHRNILVCLEDVYSSTRSIQHARSLLYVGPHHHHPLPFYLIFNLLRVLDAFTVYFIDFPDEFLKLIHLTYLSLTYNDDIPSKISQLQNLQVFMVRRQPKLIFVGVSFLPDEIWEMPNLRHLWFTETDFPSLPPKAAENRVLLLNLQSLSNVNAAFFTDEILDNMPNLKKLSMWIEGPEAINFNLAKLSKLESFKFVVLNPIPGKRVEVEPEHFFPKTLRRLHLSGCGFPWDYLRYIAVELQGLEVLKLRELAFHGEKWSVDYDFEKLKFLFIEYLNFKIWEASYSHFPRLQRLILRHCYDLRKIPPEFQYIGPLEVIELVDCSPGAVASAEDNWPESDNYEVRIFSSWEK